MPVQQRCVQRLGVPEHISAVLAYFDDGGISDNQVAQRPQMIPWMSPVVIESRPENVPRRGVSASGELLQGLCLYDYISLVRLKRNSNDDSSAAWGEVPFEDGWAPGRRWVQVLRRPGEQATVCLDGYLSKDFAHDDEEPCHRRAAVQHLALFVPWESFLCEESGDINSIWAGRERERWLREYHVSSTTCSCFDDQPKTQNATPSNGQPRPEMVIRRPHTWRRVGRTRGRRIRGDVSVQQHRRRNAPDRRRQGCSGHESGDGQIARAHGNDAAALSVSTISALLDGQLKATVISERGSVMTGFGEDDIEMTTTDSDETAGDADAGMHVEFGPSTSFFAAGKETTEATSASSASSSVERCGTGKSRVYRGTRRAVRQEGPLQSSADHGDVRNGRSADQWHHDPLRLRVHQRPRGGREHGQRSRRGATAAKAERFIHGPSRMDWQEKDVLVIDEVSMLGARTLHAVNEQLCRLRGSQQDFGGIPIILFCGDFHHSARSKRDNSFKAEQRHQHDKAHALWKKFNTVVMLDEQMRAAGDPVLQRLLKRIRLGVQDGTDLDLLNSRCYQEDRRIPWETGITVVTPLNRNRWNLNMEASLAFQVQQRSMMRIFISEHKWKDGLPMEEEAIMMLSQGDDSAIPVPAIFMFVPGIPVV
ncbi:ATP-dependent DNA helicase PIF1 [Fusarium oxysporum f. sp. conglutinans]|nr:ATP-dependent DNA helicase PIF1 [Fusarium oxysporum f. sp. conglutinans]